ncbi:MAG: TRL-like family protein [Leptospiraceae bacterium]|nr:TRL-like family protein [Leptospiraceae bacterium]
MQCAITGFNTNTGFGLLTQVTEPQEGYTKGLKKGEACAVNILGIVAYGDTSTDIAIKRANIQDVKTIDRYYFNILALYGKFCIIVSGD